MLELLSNTKLRRLEDTEDGTNIQVSQAKDDQTALSEALAIPAVLILLILIALAVTCYMYCKTKKIETENNDINPNFLSSETEDSCEQDAENPEISESIVGNDPVIPKDLVDPARRKSMIFNP